MSANVNLLRMHPPQLLPHQGSGAEKGGLKRVNEKPLFSATQIQELYNQIHVCNCIAFSLVPFFYSLGPAIYNRYPNFAVSNCTSVMDSEAGRCRRTDGRKWRCSKNVVPQEKYCERHMHRGRQRSRKHVEPIKMPQKITMKTLAVADGVKRNINVGYANNKLSSIEGNRAEGESSSGEIRKQNGGGFVSSTFGLSPKSVLHCVSGKVSEGNMKETEAERQRCRRTDGKKWQCRHDTLPNQKYCISHMHRGAKKPMFSPQSAARIDLDNDINLNVVPVSPQHTTASSMSDATTITN